MIKLLSSVVLTSNQSIVTFSNIDQSGNALILKISSGASTGDNLIRVMPNSDTNYNNYETLANFGTTFQNMIGHPFFSSDASHVVGHSTNFNFSSLNKSNITTTIVSYAKNNKPKTIVTDAWTIVNQVEGNFDIHTAAKWKNNSAITSLRVDHFNGNPFIAGSTFTLYQMIG